MDDYIVFWNRYTHYRLRIPELFRLSIRNQRALVKLMFTDPGRRNADEIRELGVFINRELETSDAELEHRMFPGDIDSTRKVKTYKTKIQKLRAYYDELQQKYN